MENKIERQDIKILGGLLVLMMAGFLFALVGMDYQSRDMWMLGLLLAGFFFGTGIMYTIIVTK